MEEQALEARANRFDARAREAMRAGRVDLARAALERKHLIEGEWTTLDRQIAELVDQQRRLTAAEQKLCRKVDAFRTRKEVVRAQDSAAGARVEISTAAGGVQEEMSDIGLATQRALDKIGRMKARAATVEELEGAATLEDLRTRGPAQKDIDHQLEEVGMKRAVDEELTRLKAELGTRGGGQPCEPPATRRPE